MSNSAISEISDRVVVNNLFLKFPLMSLKSSPFSLYQRNEKCQKLLFVGVCITLQITLKLSEPCQLSKELISHEGLLLARKKSLFHG